MGNKKEILKFCMEKGFFLDRDMLEFFVDMGDGVFDVVDKLKDLNMNEKILTLIVFDRYKDRLGLKARDSGVSESGFEVLKDIRAKSGKVGAEDFVSYFRARFEVLRDILIGKGFDNLTSIRRIGIGSGNYTVIGMVYSKRITKNKNLLIEVEDLTGRGIVLVNRENRDLFERAGNLLLDDIVAFRVSGSSKMLFANDFIYPDAKLEKEKFGDKDEFVAFVSDLHIGSSNFLEGSLMRFVSWLNSEVGDERSRNLARKVRYLILVGDNIDGVGVYPEQEKFLKIKGCRGQYKKLIEILSRVRKDIEIIMCPGQNDAVWIGEPQPGISEKWISGLDNLKLVSNPSVIKIGGLDILVSHSNGVNQFRNLFSGGGNLEVDDFMREILRRRHLAPSYGEMDIVLDKERDDLVIDELPDVFVLGGQHKVKISNYNNILNISTSCWQSRTDFEAKVGAEPEPCRVPILNLKSREVKVLDFSSEDVRWDVGDDLVCELGGCDGD